MRIFWEILSFLLLLSPTLWEIENDKSGDLNKREDIFYRIGIASVCPIPAWWLAGHHYLSGLFLCFALYFFIFDYRVSAILINKNIIEVKGANWFSYMGSSSKIDNIKFWRSMHPNLRFAIRTTVLAIALIIYF